MTSNAIPCKVRPSYAIIQVTELTNRYMKTKEKAKALIAYNLEQPAFTDANFKGGEINGKSPWNPSVRRTANVGSYAAVPEFCPCCAIGKVTCVSHSERYGKNYGEWPWLLVCDVCDASVGLHPFTNIPLGTLATKSLRNLRMRAKDAFNPLWQGGFMTRTEAYAWLASSMGLSNDKAHIGMMDADQCLKCESLSKEHHRKVLGLVN